MNDNSKSGYFEVFYNEYPVEDAVSSLDKQNIELEEIGNIIDDALNKIHNAKGFHFINHNTKSINNPSTLIVDCTDNLDNVISKIKNTANFIHSFNDIGASSTNRAYITPPPVEALYGAPPPIIVDPQPVVYGPAPAPEPMTGYIKFEPQPALYGPAPAPEPMTGYIIVDPQPALYGPAPAPEPMTGYIIVDPQPALYGPAPAPEPMTGYIKVDPQPALYGPAPAPTHEIITTPIAEPVTTEFITTPKSITHETSFDSDSNLNNNIDIKTETNEVKYEKSTPIQDNSINHMPASETSVSNNSNISESIETSFIPSTMPPESLDNLKTDLNKMGKNVGNPLNTNNSSKTNKLNTSSTKTKAQELSKKNNNTATVIAMSGAGVAGAAAIGAMTIKNIHKNSNQEEEEVVEEEDT